MWSILMHYLKKMAKNLNQTVYFTKSSINNNLPQIQFNKVYPENESKKSPSNNNKYTCFEVEIFRLI